MKVFKTAKSLLLVAILWICAIGLPAVLFIAKYDDGLEVYVLSFVFITIAALLIWTLLDTGYSITENVLIYKSGPFRGKILISSIRKIRYDNGFFKTQTLKPGLSSKGLAIFYNKYDELYISPKGREEFISEILKWNPLIEVLN